MAIININKKWIIMKVMAGRKIYLRNGGRKMRLLAYAKLLNNKINSLNRKTQNPFLDWDDSINPFKHQDYKTMIWIEQENDDDFPKFDNYYK